MIIVIIGGVAFLAFAIGLAIVMSHKGMSSSWDGAEPSEPNESGGAEGADGSESGAEKNE